MRKLKVDIRVMSQVTAQVTARASEQTLTNEHVTTHVSAHVSAQVTSSRSTYALVSPPASYFPVHFKANFSPKFGLVGEHGHT